MKKTYIDLFAGCGGLSLGFYNSGKWEGQFAIEKSPDAFRTLEFNLIERKAHFKWPNWLPQTNYDINEIITNYENELKQLRGSIDLVAGGPPCQGFSTAGRRFENDSRNQLIKSYIKFIRLVQPKVVFFENVKGFTQKFTKNSVGGKKYSDYVMGALRRDSKRLDSKGYHVFGRLVNFADFGVPQRRVRFILIGVRKDIANSFKPTDFFNKLSGSKDLFFEKKGISGNTTLEDAISDLQRIVESTSQESRSFKMGHYNRTTSAYQRLLKGKLEGLIPDSHRFANHGLDTIARFEYILEHSERNKTLSKEIKNMFNLKKRTIIPLAANLPTPTITTLPDDYIHYREPRICTVREFARIQSFNDWFEFKGKYTTGGKRRVSEVPRYSQIGNAIPPLFGEQTGIVLDTLIS